MVQDLVFSTFGLKLSEYIKVAKIIMVEVLGSVEDERTFDNLVFMIISCVTN